MKHARQAIAAALVAATFGASAATTPASLGSHHSDLWWNPTESGWGMNVVLLIVPAAALADVRAAQLGNRLRHQRRR